MSDATLERTAHFHAAHRYTVDDWTEEENERAFGDLREIHWHGYSATVWVTGPIDPITGFCVDLVTLEDRLGEIIGSLNERVLNDVLPDVVVGRLQPSCEVIARWIFRELSPTIPGAAELVRVRVAESKDLAAIWPGLR